MLPSFARAKKEYNVIVSGHVHEEPFRLLSLADPLRNLRSARSGKDEDRCINYWRSCQVAPRPKMNTTLSYVGEFSAHHIQFQFPQILQHDPSEKDWVRFHQRASWMRRLCLNPNDNCASDTLLRLSSNSPGGLLFPKLESLEWDVCKADTILPSFHLFLFPQFQCVTLSIHLHPIPKRLLAPLVQIASLFPTSLEHLSGFSAHFSVH